MKFFIIVINIFLFVNISNAIADTNSLSTNLQNAQETNISLTNKGAIPNTNQGIISKAIVIAEKTATEKSNKQFHKHHFHSRVERQLQ